MILQRWMKLSLFASGCALAVLMLWAVPASSHAWYTGKNNPVTGATCCNQTDCWEVAVEDVQDGGPVYMVNVGGYVYSFDRKEIQFSHDHKYHACVWGGELKCLFVPASF